jgi:NAD(P)-dependent dehydrogenase (short-subunit alcohol dehydrogenase family)
MDTTSGDLTGKVMVVTGASSGIGAAAAAELGRAGATVVAIGRDPVRTRAAAAAADGEPVVADFTRLADVHAAAGKILARYDRIDVLANNAGAVFPHRTITEDGHETTFQVNHLAGYLLTELLLDRLTGAGSSRVLMTSSFGNHFARVDFDDLERAHRRHGQGWLAYCATKLMNILAARELARRAAGTGLDVLAFHPDAGPGSAASSGTATNFAADTWQMRLFRRIPGVRGAALTGAAGAAPLVWLASSPAVVGRSGSYYNGTTLSTAYNRQGKSEQAWTLLAERSRAMVADYL